MNIETTKGFDKDYKRLQKKDKLAVNAIIDQIQKDPKSILNKSIHPLKGNLKGMRSIHAKGNLVILYTKAGDDTYILTTVGNHAYVYENLSDTINEEKKYDFSNGILYLDDPDWWEALDKEIAKDNSKPMPYSEFMAKYKKK